MRVPWTGRRSNQSILEEISPEYSLEVVTFCEQCPIHDLRRRFNFRTKDQAWSLKFFCFSSVQSLSRVPFSATPWTAAHQIPLSFISRSLLKFASSWWCHLTVSSSLQFFAPSGSFPMSQFFTSGGQSFGVSALASVLPKNIWGWFPLGLTGLISLFQLAIV